MYLPAPGCHGTTGESQAGNASTKIRSEVSGVARNLTGKKERASSPGKYSRATVPACGSYGVQDRIPIIMMCQEDAPAGNPVGPI